MRTTKCCGLPLLLVAVFGTGSVNAQSYPTKPIRIQTSGVGGVADVVSRIVAAELSVPLGQPFVVENRPAGPVLATGVAKAAPDGYTLLVWGTAMWITPLLTEAPYDPIRDFAPIATVGRSPYVLAVHPSLPVKTVTELIKLAKAKPGELNYSSSTNGSSSHIAGELLKSLANVDIVRVAYKAQSQETADLLSGQVQMTITSGASVASVIKAGKLRALATVGSQRSTLFPDLSTVAETVPGCVSESQLAFFAPAKTPDAIVKRLNQETLRSIEKPEVRERMLKSGLEPAGGTPEHLTDSIKSEMARIGKMIKEGVIKPGG